MKLTEQQIRAMINNLPDIHKYPHNQFRTRIMNPPSLTPYDGSIPPKFNEYARDFTFQKERLSDGSLGWVIDL